MTLFHNLLFRILQPLVEPLIERIERGVLLEDHLELTETLKNKLKKFTLGSANLIDNKLVESLLLFLEDDKREQTSSNFIASEPTDYFLILLSLIYSDLNKSDATNFQSKDLIKNLETLLLSENEHEQGILLYRNIYLLFKNANLNEIDPNNLSDLLVGSEVLEELIGLKSFKWGMSYALLSLLEIYKKSPSEKLSEYLHTLSEKLLRRLEIRREITIPFIDAPSKKIYLYLEQVRIIYFILEYAKVNNDIRFLNAALKANDRVLKYINSINISTKVSKKNLNNIELACFYLINIHNQEKLLLEVK